MLCMDVASFSAMCASLSCVTFPHFNLFRVYIRVCQGVVKHYWAPRFQIGYQVTVNHWYLPRHLSPLHNILGCSHDVLLWPKRICRKKKVILMKWQKWYWYKISFEIFIFVAFHKYSQGSVSNMCTIPFNLFFVVVKN